MNKNTTNAILHIAKKYDFHYGDILLTFINNKKGRDPPIKIYTIGEGDIKGFIIYNETKQKTPDGNDVYNRGLLFIYVCPEYRNQKIGTALLKEFEKIEGFKPVIYSVSYEENALPFYKKNNYYNLKDFNNKYADIYFPIDEPPKRKYPTLLKMSDCLYDLLYNANQFLKSINGNQEMKDALLEVIKKNNILKI